jgi:hypothetical protein
MGNPMSLRVKFSSAFSISVSFKGLGFHLIRN